MGKSDNTAFTIDHVGTKTCRDERMTNLELLLKQKSILESQIAEAQRIAEAQEKAREIQLIKAREAEVAKGIAEIHAVMNKFNLTLEDVSSAGPPQAAFADVAPRKVKSHLEMRQFYDQF